MLFHWLKMMILKYINLFQVAEEGETVRFQCAVAGHPSPWVKWYKNNDEIIPSSRLTLTERDDLSTLEIKDVTTADSALYKVMVNPRFYSTKLIVFKLYRWF